MSKNKTFNELDESDLINYFCEIFDKELDGWFSADIACCDNCYEEFIRKWPAIYTRNFEFQKKCIDIKGFYYGSTLCNIFNEDEFYELIKNIHCPNCGNSIYANFWPYNLPFDLPRNFECHLEEIDSISKQTPFLLLSHPLAKNTLDSINAIAQRKTLSTINKKYYRARKLEKNKLYTRDDFMYPPRNILGEGRYNHAGFPVIYLSDNPITCYYELKKPQEGIALAELSITKPLKILDLIELEDDCNNILNIAAWSSLMSSPTKGEGWFKPEYTFTRFIADCAISSGFNAIKYPSVRLGERHNMVILDGVNNWKILDVTKITQMKFDAKRNFL